MRSKLSNQNHILSEIGRILSCCLCVHSSIPVIWGKCASLMIVLKMWKNVSVFAILRVKVLHEIQKYKLNTKKCIFVKNGYELGPNLFKSHIRLRLHLHSDELETSRLTIPFKGFVQVFFPPRIITNNEVNVFILFCFLSEVWNLKIF